MPDTDFEARLARQLDAYAQAGVRPIDRHAIAEATIAMGARRGSLFRLGAPRPVGFGAAPRLIFALLALLALALTLWIVGQQRPGVPLGRLAYIQDGDVYVASSDGSDAVKLLDDPAVSFTKLTWLDGGDRLAVEGQGVVTVIDLTTGQRRRVGTIEGPGTWRPGGHEYAYVRSRDGELPVNVIVDIDSGASRQLPRGGQPGGELSWSPDGHWFASALDGSLMLIDATSGVTREIAAMTDEPLSIYDFAWAPDGSRFAYVTQTVGSCEVNGGCVGGQSRILVLPVDGGSPTQVAGPITDTTVDTGYLNLGPRLLPTWSPDGEWIAYRGGPGLSIVRPDGTGQRDLVTSAIGWFGWAADSSGLEYVATTNLDDASGELSWVGLADANPRSLGKTGIGQMVLLRTRSDGSSRPLGNGASLPLPPGTPPASNASAVVTPPPAPPADPRGTWRSLVFSDDSDGCNAVRRLDLSAPGELHTLTDCHRHLALSPDGAHAAVGGNTMHSHDLTSVDLSDGSRTEIAAGYADINSWFFWSPGGRWLTWQGDGRNVVVRADGSGVTELPTLVNGDNSKSWSPDDSHLAVTTADGLLVGDGSGANLVNIGTFPGVSSWSRDGSRFTYVLDGDAWVANSDGTGARNLTGFEFGGTQSMALSPDGETLAVVQAGRVLWLIELDGTRRQVDLGPGVLQDFSALRWSRDGRLLAVETRHSYGEAAGTTHLVPVDGSPITRLDDAWDPTWSPDGRYLALAASHAGVSGIDVANADGSGRVPVTTRPVTAAGEDLAWAP